jgi:hypothetical protein
VRKHVAAIGEREHCEWHDSSSEPRDDDTQLGADMVLLQLRAQWHSAEGLCSGLERPPVLLVHILHSLVEASSTPILENDKIRRPARQGTDGQARSDCTQADTAQKTLPMGVIACQEGPWGILSPSPGGSCSRHHAKAAGTVLRKGGASQNWGAPCCPAAVRSVSKSRILAAAP